MSGGPLVAKFLVLQAISEFPFPALGKRLRNPDGEPVFIQHVIRHTIKKLFRDVRGKGVPRSLVGRGPHRLISISNSIFGISLEITEFEAVAVAKSPFTRFAAIGQVKVGPILLAPAVSQLQVSVPVCGLERPAVVKFQSQASICISEKEILKAVPGNKVDSGDETFTVIDLVQVKEIVAGSGVGEAGSTK